jgi:hypothetical protein
VILKYFISDLVLNVLSDLLVLPLMVNTPAMAMAEWQHGSNNNGNKVNHTSNSDKFNDTDNSDHTGNGYRMVMRPLTVMAMVTRLPMAMAATASTLK